ncbi:MAG: ABC transporter [Catenulispora sp. 13_1_20CM_3_70_7]|nr:MAG: ABC transporter [Catenulispora sp. 13_1_20CM_3_70_7]
MFGHEFMRNAFLAGTFVALACGLVGYFLVLRAQVFTGDALSHVAFTGALGALALGVDLRIGLFATTIAVALLLGALGRRGRADDVVIGNVFAWILGLGVFFLTLYTTSRSHANGSAGVTVLFGSVFGITAGPARTAALIATLVVVATLFVARPLLFASVDEAVAAARGVPVRLLGFAFLAVVGTTAADRPYRALGLSAALAVAAVWIGLTASYLLPRIPPSFAIITTATTFYLLAFAATRLRRIWRTVDQRVVPVAS